LIVSPSAIAFHLLAMNDLDLLVYGKAINESSRISGSRGIQNFVVHGSSVRRGRPDVRPQRDAYGSMPTLDYCVYSSQTWSWVRHHIGIAFAYLVEMTVRAAFVCHRAAFESWSRPLWHDGDAH